MRLLPLSFFLLLLAAPSARADIAIIVNVDNPVAAMKPSEVADLYLGRARTFASGEYALVFDQRVPLRERFFESLVGMTQRQINAYWSRLMFTGQVLPPHSLPDNETAIKVVSRNASAIAYASLEAVTTAGVKVKVVLVIEVGNAPDQ